jgi:hypothetical protein
VESAVEAQGPAQVQANIPTVRVPSIPALRTSLPPRMPCAASFMARIRSLLRAAGCAAATGSTTCNQQARQHTGLSCLQAEAITRIRAAAAAGFARKWSSLLRDSDWFTLDSLPMSCMLNFAVPSSTLALAGIMPVQRMLVPRSPGVSRNTLSSCTRNCKVRSGQLGQVRGPTCAR